MRSGEKALAELSESIRKGIADRYGSLNTFYTNVFYNSYIEFHASREKDMEKWNKQWEELEEMVEYLETLGVPDGTTITERIADDFGDSLAKMASNKELWSPDSTIREIELVIERDR